MPCIDQISSSSVGLQAVEMVVEDGGETVRSYGNVLPFRAQAQDGDEFTGRTTFGRAECRRSSGSKDQMIGSARAR